jgi:hypothetical protein
LFVYFRVQNADLIAVVSGGSIAEVREKISKLNN